MNSSRNKTLSIANFSKEAQEAYLNNRAGKKILVEPCTKQDLKCSILHQDVLSILHLLPDNFIDLLIVDPPYNMDKMYSKSRFNRMVDSEYFDFLESWVNGIKHCLKKTASVYVCSEWRSSSMVYEVLKKHFIVRNRITWEREKGRGANNNWKNCSEDIWFATVSPDYYFNVDAVKRKKRVIAPYRNPEGMAKDWQETKDGKFRKTYPSNLWTDITVPFWSMSENTEHPTQKAEKLIAKLIMASSKEGDFIFDPFAGAGSVLTTAKKLNRCYAGVEKELDYVFLAAKRLAETNSNDAIQGYENKIFMERGVKANE